MYHIIINQQLHQSVSDEHIAYANYRAICRDYLNKSLDVQLLHEKQVLHHKPSDFVFTDDDFDKVTPNCILKSVMNRLNIEIKQLKTILQESELQLSNSRIDGWIRPVDDRKYVKMHHDELLIVLDLMLQRYQELIKTPENITHLRKKMGLTQTELAEQMGIKSGHVHISRWESGKQEMPDSKWQEMLDMAKKMKKI